MSDELQFKLCCRGFAEEIDAALRFSFDFSDAARAAVAMSESVGETIRRAALVSSVLSAAAMIASAMPAVPKLMIPALFPEFLAAARCMAGRAIAANAFSPPVQPPAPVLHIVIHIIRAPAGEPREDDEAAAEFLM
jgi:hypothetical protein